MEEFTAEEREDLANRWYDKRLTPNIPAARKVAHRAENTQNLRKVFLIALRELGNNLKYLKLVFGLRNVIFLDWLSVCELAHYIQTWVRIRKGVEIFFSTEMLESIMGAKKEDLHVKKGISPRMFIRAFVCQTLRLIRKNKALMEAQKKRMEAVADFGKQIPAEQQREKGSSRAGLKYDRRFYFDKVLSKL